MQSETLERAENVSEDSDLDRKRRETEALLQSIGISPEPPLGTWYSTNTFVCSCTCVSYMFVRATRLSEMM